MITLELLIIIPFVGALIGWSTNKLAVKMLFRPYKPIIIPLLGIEIQGVIPKRQGEIAKVVGQVVEEELLSVDDIIEHIHQSDLTSKLQGSISEAVRSKVMRKVPSFLPASLKSILSEILNDLIKKEIPPMIDNLIDKLVVNFKEDIKPSKMVEEKINKFNLLELEKVILAIASKELRHIEILGGILGFIIGLIQLLFIAVIS